MGENIIRMIILIVELFPVAFVFAIIGFYMYKNAKKRIDVSVKGHVFSWIFFALYTFIFMGTIGCLIFGKRTLALIGFVTIFASLILLAVVGTVIDFKKKSSLKQKTYIVMGKLIGASEKKSFSRKSTGMEPISFNYYSLIFEYNINGKVKRGVTKSLYTLSQIAYLNSLGGEISLKANNNICELNTDFEVKSVDCVPNDFKNSKISSIETSGTFMYYIEIFATLAFTIPIFIATTLASIMLWQNSTTVALITLFMGLLAVFIPIVAVIPYCRRKIKIAKQGVETFALDFANVGKTYATGTYCDIKYTFETDNGVKTKRERVTIDAYGKIKNLNKLPIKVYKNWAAIDLDKLP